MKSKKILVIVSVIMAIVGFIIFSVSFAINDFDIKKVDNVNYQSNVYENLGKFENINIDVDSDVNIYLSNDTKAKVVCNESETVYSQVEVKNNTLFISQKDARKWHEKMLSFQFEFMSIDVYIPYSEYQNLEIKNSSGNTTVSSNLLFNNACLDSSSGDVTFNAAVRNDLEISALSGNIYMTANEANKINLSSSSGDIYASEVKAFDRLDAGSTSGNVTVNNSRASFGHISSTSGDIDIEKLILKNNIKIEATSGNIGLNKCDAKNLDISATSGDIDINLCRAEVYHIDTTSGDVSGLFDSEKIFSVVTNSGNIDVPDSDSGEVCKVNTSSGDVDFKLQ